MTKVTIRRGREAENSREVKAGSWTTWASKVKRFKNASGSSLQAVFSIRDNIACKEAIFSDVLVEELGSLSKHDIDDSENVIWKSNFAFLQ